jgi:serine/threonine-protein kinase HipA
MLSTSIAEDPDLTASLELALEVAEHFGVSPADAAHIVAEVHTAVQTWRDVAARLGIGAREIDRMSTAFEHEDADIAASM